jgi:hypothetical protein
VNSWVLLRDNLQEIDLSGIFLPAVAERKLLFARQ